MNLLEIGPRYDEYVVDNSAELYCRSLLGLWLFLLH